MPALATRSMNVLHLRGWAARGRLFAVVDATDTPAVPARARLAGDRAVSLYRGRAEEELFAIAPHLFVADEAVVEWIAGDLWPGPWGFFALADASLEDLRLHYRRFLTVEGPSGESWYFRFYDPRVLRTYLGTCTDAELARFFGPARALAVADPDTYGVTVLSLGGRAEADTTRPVVVRR